LGGSTRSRGTGGIYRIAVLTCATETSPATGLLRSAGERYGAAAAPRPFETANSEPGGDLRIAGRVQSAQRKGGGEGKGGTLSGPTEESVWSS